MASRVRRRFEDRVGVAQESSFQRKSKTWASVLDVSTSFVARDSLDLTFP